MLKFSGNKTQLGGQALVKKWGRRSVGGGMGKIFAAWGNLPGKKKTPCKSSGIYQRQFRLHAMF